MKQVEVQGNVIRFLREVADETVLCIFNLSDHPVDTTVPAGDGMTIGGEIGSTRPLPDHTLHLGPWQPSILLLNPGDRHG